MQRSIGIIGCIGFLTSALFVTDAMAAESAALSVLTAQFGTAPSSTKEGELVVTTGEFTRSWKLIPAGLRTAGCDWGDNSGRAAPSFAD